ncbi:MAG TPA: glycosyltransferase [Caulobacteraceae bacterium]|nr:glycosyltransferase [Caulobacteraceae bacterium]
MSAGQGRGDPPTVLCMKWGAKYGPDYVNRLYGMVARNLARPFRLVCLTDDASGVRQEVVCAPIPALPPIPQPKERGWTKLAAFSPALEGLLGDTVLYLDLDIVVMGALDPLFEQPGAFPMIRDWYHRRRVVGNSSVFRFRPAERRALFEAFCADADAIVQRIRNEQEFISEHLEARGELSFWPKAWCQSFRVSCLAPWPVRAWATPRRPDECRVLVFHGEPKPPEALVGRPALFQTFRPAPWIAELWRE